MGAVLAFAVNLNTTGIDINTIGAILMVVGIIGLLFSFIALEGWFGGSRVRHYDSGYVDDYDRVTPPHEHRRVDTRDVVYEEDAGPDHVERVRRVRR
jgi:hypothetical protein